MKNMKNRLLKHKSLIMIIFICLITAVLQGNSTFYFSSHSIKMIFFAIVLFAYAGLFYYLFKSGKLTLDNQIFMITLAGVILRSFYVLFTGVNDRQHDEGTFTSLTDTFVNPGHLGYIEYLCKFKHLPDFSPYQLFSYYHPPVHHIIASIFIQINLLLGVTEKLAFENIQVLTLLYSSLCISVSYKILMILPINKSCIRLSVSLIALHPGMIYMSGSVNNDMLATLLTFVCFYYALVWMQNKTLPNLIKIALALGFGMIIKLNTAVMAFPLAVIFLYHLIEQTKKGNFKKCIRNYFLFLCVCASIGLSWVIRNLIFYRTNPGVPVLTEESVLYIGRHSWLEIFGLPSDFIIRYPFHTINGNQICNSWLILFRTSIFAEIRPDNLGDFLMALCQMALILTMIFGVVLAFITIWMQIREYKKGDKELGLFLLTGFLSVIITFIGFIIKYPYTCSCDFRYVVISILFASITLFQLNAVKNNRYIIMLSQIMNFGIIAILVLTTSIFLFWNQW